MTNSQATAEIKNCKIEYAFSTSPGVLHFKCLGLQPDTGQKLNSIFEGLKAQSRPESRLMQGANPAMAPHRSCQWSWALLGGRKNSDSIVNLARCKDFAPPFEDRLNFFWKCRLFGEGLKVVVKNFGKDLPPPPFLKFWIRSWNH